MTDTSNIYVTSGAQHAIFIALRLLAQPGDQILVENLTYSGLTALSLMLDYRLHGVAMDKYGLLPDALDTAFAQSDAKILCCTPTIQTANRIVSWLTSIPLSWRRSSTLLSDRGNRT